MWSAMAEQKFIMGAKEQDIYLGGGVVVECGEGGQWLFAPHKTVTVYSDKFCLMVLPCPLLERDLGSNPAKINIYFSCLACTPSPPTHNQALLAPPQAAST